MARQQKPEGGQWTTKVLGTVKISDTISWKAQRSVAPDGAVFLSVRKFATKKDGSETPTKAAITLVADNTFGPNIKAVMELLPKLKARGQKQAQPEAADDGDEPDALSVVLVNLGGDYLMKIKKTVDPGSGQVTRKYVVTQDLTKAKRFATSAEANRFGEQTRLFMLKSGWKIKDLNAPKNKRSKK